MIRRRPRASRRPYILAREELRRLPKRKRSAGDGRTIPICIRVGGSLIGYKYAEPLVGMRLRHSFDPGTFRVRAVGRGEMLVIQEDERERPAVPHRGGVGYGLGQWVKISDEWQYDWCVDLELLPSGDLDANP